MPGGKKQKFSQVWTSMYYNKHCLIVQVLSSAEEALSAEPSKQDQSDDLAAEERAGCLSFIFLSFRHIAVGHWGEEKQSLKFDNLCVWENAF